MHKASYWASLQSFGPSFFNIMTKLNSLARARVIGPKGGAEDGATSAGVGEGAAGVDVLVVSSSLTILADCPRSSHRLSGIQKSSRCVQNALK
jgi:hypothetical protein